MTELEKKIKKYSDDYYQNGNSEISDAEFDALIEELKITTPDSVLLKGITGDDLKGVSKKVKLPITMGTLAKCMDEKEFHSHYYSHPHNSLVLELKLDGVGFLLEYEEGKFVKAYSRGNSEYAEDATLNLSKVKFPKLLNVPFTGYVRGEVLMTTETFNEYFANSAKNPRNLTAGIVKRLDGKDCDKLIFYAYDVFDSEDLVDAKEEYKIKFLENNNFKVPSYWFEPSYEDILQIRNNLEDYTKGLPCDGLVIKQNVVDKPDLMRKTPMNNYAFKPAPNIRITTIKDIIWQMPGSILSPVAIVEPVELDGTTVERASLSNINIMKKLGVYVGGKCQIKKSGMIIPKIISMVEPKEDAFSVPEKCPVCNSDLEVDSSGFPVCVNEKCQRKTSHRFAKMFDILGVKETGDAFISNLEKNNVSVKQFLDYIKADDKKINTFAGGINGEKIITQMKKAMAAEISVPKFLALFDCDGFDEKKLNLLSKYTLDEMYGLTVDEIKNVKGFANITANRFVKFMSDYHDEIETIRAYFNIVKPTDPASGVLNGKSFCFTGAAVLPRSKLQEMVIQNGGVNKSGVSKDLSYLVTDDTTSGSSKNKKAAELGIPVITSTEFLEMIKLP